ncbi:NUDIX hydrolase [Kaarinaea lacus]
MKDQATDVFEGKIVRVYRRTIKLPNDYLLDLEVVEHPGGAAIVAINDQREICLIKQYRAVFDEWFWELPAGKRDNEEPPLNTAKRELLEEAGVEARKWLELGSMASSPGVFTERVYLYLASDLRLGVPEFADDEVISERQWVSLDQACQWAYDGKINDAKSVIAILRAAHALQ